MRSFLSLRTSWEEMVGTLGCRSFSFSRCAFLARSSRAPELPLLVVGEPLALVVRWLGLLLLLSGASGDGVMATPFPRACWMRGSFLGEVCLASSVVAVGKLEREDERREGGCN